MLEPISITPPAAREINFFFFFITSRFQLFANLYGVSSICSRCSVAVMNCGTSGKGTRRQRYLALYIKYCFVRFVTSIRLRRDVLITSTRKFRKMFTNQVQSFNSKINVPCINNTSSFQHGRFCTVHIYIYYSTE